MYIDILHNYSNNVNESEILIRSQGLIQDISNGTNIAKDGGEFHKKDNVKVLWDTNTERNELASMNVISLCKHLHNKQVEGT